MVEGKEGIEGKEGKEGKGGKGGKGKEEGNKKAIVRSVSIEGKKRSKFSHLLTVRLGAVTPTPHPTPYGQPDSFFLTASLSGRIYWNSSRGWQRGHFGNI